MEAARDCPFTTSRERRVDLVVEAADHNDLLAPHARIQA
jgi:hypothetical protein